MRLTQEQLAERSGYSVDFIGLIERGINAPTLDRLEDIARELKTEPWQLLRPSPGSRK
jgi:transcriptional regulator with XRE-family HTH domain